MSMLAEPRRKQKVINLRAKNNAWSNDSNKFGQRMLEKMGWSSGKGLGVKENGIVEHVVAKYKNDEKGLGFEDRNDQWTKHEDDFNALLANLSNAESNTETLHSGISLEKKSKKSKTRIHYHKFTRGKDLSRYSEKDLANIFGKKSFKEKKVEECIKEDVKTLEQVFTDKGNMDDYFKNKLAAFKSKTKLFNTDTNIKDEKVSDYTFQGFSNYNEANSENIQNGLECQPFSFYNTQKEDLTQNIELTTCSDVEITNSKKKKKSKKKDQMSSECSLETIQHVIVSQKVQKKICSETNNEVENNSTQYTKDQQIVLDASPKVKKSKKKKHQEYIEEEIQEGEVNTSKKNKNSFHVQDQENDTFAEDYVPKKKKKRKNQDL